MDKQAILVADLGFGDAGKGSIVDFLARNTGAHCVVRYNGGAQAAHNVVTSDGRHHTFAQFGSATFLPGVRTHLSRFMLVHPINMLAEERHLSSLGVKDAFSRLTVDRNALIISPYQQAANRIKEIARGDGLHGSCGLGIGETMSDWLTYGSQVLLAGDLANRAAINQKLAFLRGVKRAQLLDFLQDKPASSRLGEELSIFDDPDLIELTADIYLYWANQVMLVESDHLAGILHQPDTVIFEGAQGVLLDEWWGFYPYNSWSTLTYKNADTLLAEAGWDGAVQRLGLTRAYMTRHGTGPMVTEDPAMTAALPDLHNRDNAWQHAFRVGPLDLPALRYALRVIGGVDGLVVTHMDRLASLPDWCICDRYISEQATEDLFFEEDGRNICPVQDPTDLAQQERLTRALLASRPDYMSVERDQQVLLDLVAERLSIPVVLTSSGLTADEKNWLKQPGMQLLFG